MLEELHIRNVALIDSLTIRFSEGLTILSGETGAGKSILVGALGMALGVKTPIDVIRTGAEEAEVSAVLHIGGVEEAEDWIRRKELPEQEGVVIVRRILRRNGRGGCYIQNVPVSVSDLQEFTKLLVDLHGQHEHQSLLNEDNHRLYLDRFAGISDRVNLFYKKFQEVSALRKKREDLKKSEQERVRELEYLQYAIDEIEQAAITPGEEEELLQEKKLLLSHEKLVKGLTETISELSEKKEGGLGSLRRGLNLLQYLSGVDSILLEYHKRLESLYYELQDIVEALKAYGEKRVFDPERLETIEDRLGCLYKLTKKYGPTLQDVLAFKENAAQKIYSLTNVNDELEKMDSEILLKEKELLKEAEVISDIRKKEASRLQQAITESLHRLGMQRTRFQISVTRKEPSPRFVLCGPYGFDTVTFLISPNPGEPLKPLKDIASGGEISRIMLAMKTVLAETDSIRCLIFDEVDAGIGGETALVVGEYLQTLSRLKQVLVITHLASIAARGDTHYKVEKRVEGDRTLTDIKSIEGEERIKEIARMLSGEPGATVSLAHAEELLKRFRR